MSARCEDCGREAPLYFFRGRAVVDGDLQTVCRALCLRCGESSRAMRIEIHVDKKAKT